MDVLVKEVSVWCACEGGECVDVLVKEVSVVCL